LAAKRRQNQSVIETPKAPMGARKIFATQAAPLRLLAAIPADSAS